MTSSKLHDLLDSQQSDLRQNDASFHGYLHRCRPAVPQPVSGGLGWLTAGKGPNGKSGRMEDKEKPPKEKAKPKPTAKAKTPSPPVNLSDVEIFPTTVSTVSDKSTVAAPPASMTAPQLADCLKRLGDSYAELRLFWKDFHTLPAPRSTTAKAEMSLSRDYQQSKLACLVQWHNYCGQQLAQLRPHLGLPADGTEAVIPIPGDAPVTSLPSDPRNRLKFVAHKATQASAASVEETMAAQVRSLTADVAQLSQRFEAEVQARRGLEAQARLAEAALAQERQCKEAAERRVQHLQASITDLYALVTQACPTAVPKVSDFDSDAMLAEVKRHLNRALKLVAAEAKLRSRRKLPSRLTPSEAPGKEVESSNWVVDVVNGLEATVFDLEGLVIAKQRECDSLATAAMRQPPPVTDNADKAAKLRELERQVGEAAQSAELLRKAQQQLEAELAECQQSLLQHRVALKAREEEVARLQQQQKGRSRQPEGDLEKVPRLESECAQLKAALEEAHRDLRQVSSEFQSYITQSRCQVDALTSAHEESLDSLEKSYLLDRRLQAARHREVDERARLYAERAKVVESASILLVERVVYLERLAVAAGEAAHREAARSEEAVCRAELYHRLVEKWSACKATNTRTPAASSSSAAEPWQATLLSLTGEASALRCQLANP